MNKREVTCFVLQEGSALTPATCVPTRGLCSTLLWWSWCMLCCTIKSSVFCIHAAVGSGQGGKVYWELLLNSYHFQARKAEGGEGSVEVSAPSGCYRGHRCTWSTASQGPLVFCGPSYAPMTSSLTLPHLAVLLWNIK